MSASDLKRLVQRATPRVEDVRSPDRTDIIRREHGHLTLREIVDAADALEFSAVGFLEQMRGLVRSEEASDEAPAAAAHTAAHGLFRALDGLRFLSPGLAEEAAPGASTGGGEEEAPEGEAGEEQLKAAAEARQRGAEAFKGKDFAQAVAEYTAAIRALPRGHAELHMLYSNRSAARLQRQPGVEGNSGAEEALADARRCVELAPDWPKGRFREGSCLRQLNRLAEATAAFRAGKALEPDNKDWDKEIDKTETLRCTTLPVQARQLLFSMLPELLWAWARGDDAAGVLQVQANGEFKELSAAKWRLVREGRTPAKAQLRYAFMGRKDYLANLAANLQKPADGVAVVDVEGKPLKIPEIGSFLPEEGDGCATIHVDVRNGAGLGKMVSILCKLPCDDRVKPFLATRKEPERPKGTVESVLDLQRTSGFPKALPRLLGFQALPGDLNFPVIDLERDAPNAKNG